MNIYNKLMRIYGNPYDTRKPVAPEPLSDKMLGLIEKIGAFLAADSSLIKDAERLPVPKQTIIKVLSDAQAAFGSVAKNAKRARAYEEECEAKRMIQSLEMAMLCINTYAQIDSADKKWVDYYNSFADIDDIPMINQTDFIKLQNKYRLRGTRGLDSE